MTNSRLFTFVAGNSGPWRILKNEPVSGEELPAAERLNVVNDAVPALPADAIWMFHGVTSNPRYTTAPERSALNAIQSLPGRPEATLAAFIPMRKSAAWWDLTQDARRRIFEESSQHIALGAKYIPAIARRLHHCRDLATDAPFDFLTWFDYAPENAGAFEDLVGQFRATEEWKYVEREVDIRLTL